MSFKVNPAYKDKEKVAQRNRDCVTQRCLSSVLRGHYGGELSIHSTGKILRYTCNRPVTYAIKNYANTCPYKRTPRFDSAFRHNLVTRNQKIRFPTWKSRNHKSYNSRRHWKVYKIPKLCTKIVYATQNKEMSLV